MQDVGAMKAPGKVKSYMWSEEKTKKKKDKKPQNKKPETCQVSEGWCMLPAVESGFIHYMKSTDHMVSLSILKKICFLSLQRHFLPDTDFPSMWQQF